MVSTVQRSALLLYSCEQMFALVNDIEAYPEFVSGCVKAKVLESSNTAITAQLSFKKAGVVLDFTTCNTLEYPYKMTMTLVDGPFSRFSGVWTFDPLQDEAQQHLGCKVSLDLQFAMKNAVLGRLAQGLLESVGANLVDAFSLRARAIYT